MARIKIGGKSPKKEKSAMGEASDQACLNSKDVKLLGKFWPGDIKGITLAVGRNAGQSHETMPEDKWREKVVDVGDDLEVKYFKKELTAAEVFNELVGRWGCDALRKWAEAARSVYKKEKEEDDLRELYGMGKQHLTWDEALEKAQSGELMI